jgi:transcriptional regulator GlxA family with amidase domain
VCAGAFVLAAAGLLDGRRAATHWELAAGLARASPQVTVDADAIFVADGPIHTSAGVTAGIDLCLAPVEADHGAELARDVARHLVVCMQRPGGQAQFSVRLDHRLRLRGVDAPGVLARARHHTRGLPTPIPHHGFRTRRLGAQRGLS